MPSSETAISFHVVLGPVDLHVIPLSSDIQIKPFASVANILIPSLDVATPVHVFVPIFAIFQLDLSESSQQAPVTPAGVV